MSTNSSPNETPTKIVVDSIHGDIHPTDQEWRVIDTPSFQRLRHLKQLGMGQVTYPNATHTRFAHSLGVLHIMSRVLRIAETKYFPLSEDQRRSLRLAALLHDIGHYPYSHLMDGLDWIELTEDKVKGNGASKKLGLSGLSPYPDHEELGGEIVTHQQDLLDAIGDADKAKEVADLFTRGKAADKQFTKLIHSSLDMDRIDYLLRDSNATGVPYGQIDINYLLNNLEISPNGMLGVTEKALPAAEQFLFARYFMHQVVYFHKTTFGIEEACRQLLRRIRNEGKFDFPKNGNEIRNIATGENLGLFTDSYIDNVIRKAASDSDEVIQALAMAILSRRPPKLLKEVQVLKPRSEGHSAETAFRLNFRHHIQSLAESENLPLGLFMFCDTGPLKLEKRGGLLTGSEARALEPEDEDELIKVFVPGEVEPKSLVEIERSLVRQCANNVFQAFRLYVVCQDEEKVARLRDRIRDWDKP